ncbi:bifunctional WD40 repeat/WD40-YVTN repeat-like-containing domain superfamily/WD40-repeat-containing domain superfamily [Babesia duncani]|uniref:Bifunctional WD40 repeat/WD40-YVTN repeat-like-containing domain superfamily/WD40-repeat-containing domain superfamily n=1 Tax=Babesia duncani TaxID=323732 RepID=A0AAD9PM67_9APIC|nr:bifunctional WD40 repeat/WD40-YVTN repeat-like-containing domain superfamily/WD40-repeat-containing domain superfamily [Babesia duncani]
MSFTLSLQDLKCHYVNQIPDDTVTRLAWNNAGSPLLLAATSWDKTCRIYKIASAGDMGVHSELGITYRQEAPLLSCCFSNDNLRVFAGGCNQSVSAFDLGSNSTTGMVVGRHDKPISGVHWVPSFNAVLTCGWDGKVALWDGRQQNALWSQVINAKIFASDVKGNLLSVADNMGKIHTWNLDRIRHNEQKLTSNSLLRTQVRALSLFPDTTHHAGVAVSSICGRCAVMWLKPDAMHSNFSFKCHRLDQHKGGGKTTLATCINGLDFHTTYGTFITGANDGTLAIWDKDNRAKVRQFTGVEGSVVSISFQSYNNLVAFATGYDWHMGLDRNLMVTTPKRIGVIRLKEEDIKKSKSTISGRR